MSISQAPVLVRGRIPKWLTVSRNLTFVGIVAGSGLLFVHEVAAIATLAISILLLIGLQLLVSAQRHKQRWITDTGEGFIVEDRAGQRTYGDEDIYSLDLETQNVYSQGVLKGMRRVFRVKVQDEPQEIVMTNLIGVGEADPLAGFIARTVEQYREQADEALAAGAVVKGKNWSLSSAGVTVEGKSADMIPLDDISYVGLFDGQVCIWKSGEQEASLKVPARSRNAYLLMLLTSQRAQSRPPEAADANGLGRVLFERKGLWVVKFLVWVLGLVLGLPAIVLTLAGVAQGEPWALLAGVLLLAAIPLVIWLLRAQGRTVFRCHERGVYQRRMFSETQLTYAEVEEFTYSATRQYYNGAYIGTALVIALKSKQGDKPRSVRFQRSVKNADEDLENLSNHIAAVLGARMLARLASGEPIQWTKNLTILPTGIEYRPPGFTGRKAPVTLPFANVSGFDIQEGTFHLWETGKTKSVMREAVGTANFFPGYFVLRSLYASRSG